MGTLSAVLAFYGENPSDPLHKGSVMRNCDIFVGVSIKNLLVKLTIQFLAI